MGGALSDDDTMAVIGASMVLGRYILSIIDANLPTKKINAMKLKKYQPEDTSTSFNYIPHQGLIASYNLRF